MQRVKGLKNKKTLLVKIAIPIIAFAVAAICLSLFWPTSGEASGKVALQEIEMKSLSEAKRLVPETESIRSLAGEGAEFNGMYSLDDRNGKSIGAISIDSMTGEIVCFYDASEQGPSSEVLISLDQARDIVEKFLLEEKGIYVKGGPLTYIRAELKRDGVGGTPENPIEEFSYIFEIKEAANGVSISSGTAINIGVSPKDGRIIGYSIIRGNGSSLGKEVKDIKLSEDEAIAIATKAAQDKLQLFSKPYVLDSKFTYYDDLGDGRMTPCMTLTLYFGSSDLDSTLMADYSVNAIINLQTGEIISIATASEVSASSESGSE